MKAKRKKLPIPVYCEGQENENPIQAIKIVSDGEIKKGDGVWYVRTNYDLEYAIYYGIVRSVSVEGFLITRQHDRSNNAFKDVNNAISYYKKKTISTNRNFIKNRTKTICSMKKENDSKQRVINEFKTQISN